MPHLVKKILDCFQVSMVGHIPQPCGTFIGIFKFQEVRHMPRFVKQ